MKKVGIPLRQVAYTYTPFGQTASVAKTEDGSTTTTSFQYDAFGKRIAKTTGDKVTQSVWSGDDIFYEYITEGTTVKNFRYFHGPAGYEGCMDQNGHIYISQLNYKGDVVGTMNFSNTDIERHSYTSFGQTDDDNFVSPYGFSGEYTDVETGHQYLRNRYYDPATSRFTQEDNNFIDGFNLYAYCVNDPINYTDPSGNCCGFPMNWNTEVLSQPNVSVTSEPGWRLCKDYDYHKLGKERPSSMSGTTSSSSGQTIIKDESEEDTSHSGLQGWIDDVANWFDDTIIKPIDKFIGDISEDIRNYDKYNEDENKVLESHYFSSYKGVPVFRINGNRSGSFGVIFLTRETNSRNNPEDVLRHEYGHTKQLEQLGIIKYALCIGLPSWQEWGEGDYYDKPWEITADIYGGVQSRVHNKKDVYAGFAYLEISKQLGPLAWLFIK